MNCDGRYNFDRFGMAFLTVFLIVSQDDWNRIMYAALRADVVGGKATVVPGGDQESSSVRTGRVDPYR